MNAMIVTQKNMQTGCTLMENKKVMQIALECLLEFKNECDEYRWSKKDNDCIETLSTALAQPEQEPYGYLWFTRHMEQRFTHRKPKEDERIGDVKPLYTIPPKREWVGLTDEEYEAMAEDHVTDCYFDTLTYAKAIEAKLKKKNL